MTDASYSHIVILADRTGSMGSPAEPGAKTKAELTTAGIHDLIADQAAQPGKTTFTLIQFDDMSTDRIADFAPGSDSALMTWKIIPRGNTPLLDATGKAITVTGEALNAMPEGKRPGRVFFVIGTDGLENASREYSKKQVAEMVTHQQDAYGWEFAFIGADIDAFAEAGGMGFRKGSTLNTMGANTRAAYRGTSSSISRSRVSGQSLNYTDEERKKAAGK